MKTIERFDEDTVRILVSNTGCPVCDDGGCEVCNSQLRPRPLRVTPKGTVAPATK